MKRTCVLAVVLLLVCLLGGAIWLTNRLKPAIAISAASAAENDEDVLAALSEGCANAVSSIRSGSGHATTYFWSKRGDGGVLETETENYLKFKGDRFLLREKAKYLTVDPTPGKDYSCGPGTEACKQHLDGSCSPPHPDFACDNTKKVSEDVKNCGSPNQNKSPCTPGEQTACNAYFAPCLCVLEGEVHKCRIGVKTEGYTYRPC